MDQTKTKTSKLFFRAILEYDDTIDLPETGEKLPGAYIGKGKGAIEGKRIKGQFLRN